jgi:hypothetical protein
VSVDNAARCPGWGAKRQNRGCHGHRRAGRLDRRSRRVGECCLVFAPLREGRCGLRVGGEAAALDSQRRHNELTPEFDISITAGENGVGEHAKMRVALTGPAGLDRLDEVSIAIIDEAEVGHWAHGLPDKVSLEEARRFVWGPWEFNTGASAQVTDNEATRPRPYSRPDGRNSDLLSLLRTRPGHWMGSTTLEQWQRQQDGGGRGAAALRGTAG